MGLSKINNKKINKSIYKSTKKIYNVDNEKGGIINMKFYVCEHCGNIVAFVKESGVPVMCCGAKMKELVPGTSDGATEKHVPVIEVSGNTVTVSVGSVAHPMAEEHYIQWIALETKEGNQRKLLKPGEEPKAVFAITETDEVVAAYEYCNLHGLWKAEM